MALDYTKSQRFSLERQQGLDLYCFRHHHLLDNLSIGNSPPKIGVHHSLQLFRSKFAYRTNMARLAVLAYESAAFKVFMDEMLGAGWITERQYKVDSLSIDQ